MTCPPVVTRRDRASLFASVVMSAALRALTCALPFEKSAIERASRDRCFPWDVRGRRGWWHLSTFAVRVALRDTRVRVLAGRQASGFAIQALCSHRASCSTQRFPRTSSICSCVSVRRGGARLHISALRALTAAELLLRSHPPSGENIANTSCLIALGYRRHRGRRACPRRWRRYSQSPANVRPLISTCRP